jgi:phage-related protein
VAGSIGRVGSSASSASGGISLLGGRMTALVSAGLSAVPTLVSLGQAIIAMAPAAAIAAPALGSLVAVFGALKLGLGGIGGAFKQAFAPATGGASAAGAATHALADAQTALKIAIRDTADSNRHAVQAVAAAERDLTDAQRTEKQAQLDLIKARKEAQQQLEDYQQQLVDGELDHRQAILDVDQAKADLDKTLADPTATDLQKQQAQLAYDQAVQHLKEQEIAQQRLKDEADAAAKAGVDGNEKVQQAVQGVADAQQGVLDKEQALSEARISQAEAAEDGAIRVAQAQQAVADAMKSTGGAAGGAASAIAKLAPAAREFVNAVIALKPAWDALKLDVQQTLFKGLGDRLTGVAHQVLPDLRTGLVGTAEVLNRVAVNALDAIGNLSKTGTLRQAFSGITAGLAPLEKVPSQIITMFGQLTAAAGPAFGRVTQLIADVVGSFGKKLGDSFASGGLTNTINAALNVVGQFGKLLGDILGTVGNVLKAAGAAGGDALGMLGSVFAELRKVTASPEVQGALTALFATFQKLATTVAPLVGMALKELGPVISALAPPVQMLISNLGAALQPIIAALGPVLLAAAKAVGSLLNAVSPLLPVVGTLIAQLGPAISPIFQALAGAFQAAAPVVAQLGQVIASVLSPILAQLPVIMQPLMDLWLTWNTALLPVLSQLLAALQPALQQLSGAFMQIMVALAPVIVQLGNLLAQVLPPLLSILTPVIKLVGQLASIFAGELAKTVEQIVVPALRMVTQLLHGDFSGAFDSAKQVVKGMINLLIDQFVTLPAKIVGALGDLGRTLWNAGSRLISGLIDGIWSKLSDLRRALSNITNMLPDWKGPAEKDAVILGPAGQLLIEGLMGGIASRVPDLRAQLQGITGEIGTTPIGFGTPSLTAPGAVVGAPTTGGAQALGPAPTPVAAGSTVTIQNLTISGTWDLSSAADRTAAANAMVGEIKEALRAYDRGRAR